MGALGGAIAGGLAPTSAATSTGDAFTQGASRAGLSNAATQGVAVAVGLQNNFSWNGVAAAALAGGVSSAVNDSIGRSPWR